MENLNSVIVNEKKQKNPSKVAYLHAHGSKKFEVELFAGQHKVYEKLFRKSTAHRISVIQIALAVLVVMAQISTMCLLQYYSSMEYQGLGIWTSTITVLSAGFSLSACKKTTYIRLHFAMALHILSIIGSIMLVTCAFADAIPTQRSRVFRYLTKDNPNRYGDYYNRQTYNNYDNYNMDSNSTTPRSYYSHDSYYNNYYDDGPIGILVTTLALSSIMALAGLVQIVMSLVMSIMSGRAMCAGRSKMEGKIFAMKIKGQEEGDVIAAAAASNTNKENLFTDLSLNPPPYDKVSLGNNNTSSFA